MVPFYKLTIVISLGLMKLPIIDLKYVPAGMEPHHFSKFGRSVNLSSSVLITQLMELFNRRQLMATHTVPYMCCKIHLRKDPSYWFDPEDVTSISQSRFKLMMDEIEQVMGGFVQ